MHYYQRNLGDYAKKAGRLTMLEHGAYTLLLDSCYDRERFPTKRDAYEWTWARNPDERAAVDFVLERFFELEGEIYIQRRVQDELQQYWDKCKKNKEIAENREKAKRTKRGEKSTKRARLDQERAPNQEPITNNQEPITKNQVRRDSAPPPLASLEKFRMTADWQPDPNEWHGHALSLGVKPELTSGEIFDRCLAGFRLHHVDDGQAYTQGKWHLKLANWIKSETAKNKSGYLPDPDNPTSGMTPEERAQLIREVSGG